MSNYVTYHLHSYYSLLDSCTSPEEYINKAKELGQAAIAFTEHGNIFNWFEKKLLCDKAGIKYIHGIECYVTETLDEKIRDNWHTILLAKNYDGFVELNNLFYTSYQKDHSYYKRRISLDEFLNISDNIIKISACIQSPIWQMRKSIMNGNNDAARKSKYVQMLKHYDYYEIQYHTFLDQIEYNRFLYKISQKYNKPLIVGTDTHSLNPYKAECRTMLQYGKTDGAWGEEENECDLSYKSYEELVEAFRIQDSLPMDIIEEAIENTNVMANSVEELTIDTHNKYPFLYGDDDEKVMWDVLKKNYKSKLKDGIISDSKEYIENIKEEMAVFKKTNMVGFMLFMSELMTWAKDNDIATGSARGSVAGSTVAYISNITDVDPIKWHTIFSRFCNEHRVEIGDIDTDWYEDDRQKIFDYIINRFGTEKTGYVFAVGTLADKAVIDTIGKAYRIKAEKNNTTTPYTLEKIKEIKTEYGENPEETKQKYPEIFYYYDGLVNCVVSQSQHPAGIIASPVNLIDFCGAFIGENGQQILPLDMDCCHDAGLVKYDILGLKTVGVIDKTCKLIGRKYPKVHEIDFDDQEVYKDMTNNHNTIFQFESQFAGDCLQKMNCKSVFDMSLVNACIRPSGESYRDKLLARIPNKNPSELIDKLLENNYGWLIYQEDTIAFLQQICGFSGSDADNVRRAIGRKKVDELNKALPKILDGYCSKSDKPREEAEEEARQFLKVIEDSSSYQFGYNHSVAYSILSYLCGYFRHYYPVEYCTSYLNCAKNEDDIFNGTELAKSLGIKIESPTFGFSQSEYTCNPENKVIYKGLGSIKYMSDEVGRITHVISDKHYDSFVDLLIELKNTAIDTRQLDILIKIDFFRQFGEINQLLFINDKFNKIYGKKQFKVDQLDKVGIPIWVIQQYATKQTEKTFSGFDSVELLKGVLHTYEMPETTMIDIINYQMECLGYIQYIRSDLKPDYYYVSNLDSNKLTLYQLNSGNSIKIKIRKNTLKDNPIETGKIIKVLNIKQEPRWIKNPDGSWGRDENNLEDILASYKVLK